MTSKRFLEKHHVCMDDILYIKRENRYTIISMKDGNTFSTVIPVKNFGELMPLRFLSVNKGLLLNKEHIKSIDRGVYEMDDGTQFHGRVRTPGAHSKAAADLYEHQNGTFPDAFQVFMKMPLPFVCAELIRGGGSFSFIIRAINEEAGALFGVPAGVAAGLPLIELFRGNGNRVFLKALDTVVNSRRFSSRSIIDGHVLYFFSPSPEYCALVAVPSEAGIGDKEEEL